MQDLKFIAIIPARFASTRFPGKPLAPIGGKPMIQRVYEQVSKTLSNVYVATDDQRIFDAVISFGGKAVMTSEKHRSGTDRCYEAYQLINRDFDVIINVQGDEPFIQPSQIDEIMNCFKNKTTQIATLVKKIEPTESTAILFNPNSPKVVISNDNTALYFSRSPIPFLRNFPEDQWTKRHNYYKHIGVYAYTPKTLQKITELAPSSLEQAESLEQLRWIENGYQIKVGFTDVETIGIDTPEDLKKAEQYLEF
jgi:3-deoxy-manno-octulosonate cytidylyltransferase (CMP-KDO synthetase)